MKLIILVLLSIFSNALFAMVDFDKQQIQERIQPYGKVRVEGAEVKTPIPSVAAKPAEEGPPGKVIYEQYCVMCHRDGLAGAPRFENEADWKPRLAGKSMDDILVIVKKGLNAMPAKGTCNDCTDEDFRAVILYMKPKS